MSKELSRIEILGGLLHRICNYDPSIFELSFKDRLILQKTIYLLEQFGLYLGYSFNWYLRGPYSPELTRDAFSLMQKYEELPQISFVEEADEIKLRKFLDFLKSRSNDEEWLEIVGSTHFLYKYSRIKDKNVIWEKMRVKIPNLSRAKFDACWNELEEYNLLEQ